MGVTISVYFSLGVPVKKLCKHVNIETRNQYKIHDVKTGKPTGKMSEGEKYLVGEFLNGEKFSIKGGYPDELQELVNKKVKIKDLEIEALVPYNATEQEELDTMFVGNHLFDRGGYQSTIDVVDDKEAEKIEAKLKKLFEQKFGYTGKIYKSLISLCSY